MKYIFKKLKVFFFSACLKDTEDLIKSQNEYPFEKKYQDKTLQIVKRYFRYKIYLYNK